MCSRLPPHVSDPLDGSGGPRMAQHRLRRAQLYWIPAMPARPVTPGRRCCEDRAAETAAPTPPTAAQSAGARSQGLSQVAALASSSPQSCGLHRAKSDLPLRSSKTPSPLLESPSGLVTRPHWPPHSASGAASRAPLQEPPPPQPRGCAGLPAPASLSPPPRGRRGAGRSGDGGVGLFKPQLCHVPARHPGPTWPRPLCLSFLMYKMERTDPSSQGAAASMKGADTQSRQGPAQACAH